MRLLLLSALILFSLPLFGEREPVLKQVDEPHPYYWREMYIPQLTTGPSSVAWSPDSKTLVYSMAGSLWRQDAASQSAEELTAGPGYDYQPDWSPDGRWILYTKYNADAMELWVYDVQTKQARALTKVGAVNVEPRFSPDGTRIVFVSTQFNRRFHIFTADFDSKNGTLSNTQRLTGETRSPLPRYYYSPFDHEISPTWSPDGKEIIFISNRGHIYGTGGLWRMPVTAGAFDRGEMREIHAEETNWKARPDWSRDGRRVVYSSYNGRQWNQLWLVWSQGGDPLPLTFGEYDNVAPRWSPDAKRIAFISNRSGNTSLWMMDVPGTGATEIRVLSRKHSRPMGRLHLTVLGEDGKPAAARVSVLDEYGRTYAPVDAWMYADDGFDRYERSFEAHYFHTTGKSEFYVPAGKISVEVMRGFAHRVERRTIDVARFSEPQLEVKLQRLDLPRDFHDFESSDVHVHMNYGGTYHNDFQHLRLQGAAEDLDVIENLVVNKEQRFPDIASPTAHPVTDGSTTQILTGQEYHTSYWGHIGILKSGSLVLPGFSGYSGTAMASLYPMNADIADIIRGKIGYVHPFDELPDPDKDASLNHELPVDVALNKVSYLEVLGFSDHKSTAEIWYRLLNCGFELPAEGGTDAMANYASLRGPVGMNRVYARHDEYYAGPLDGGSEAFSTNGPLLGFTIQGEKGQKKTIGSRGYLSQAEETHFSLWLRSIVPVDHAQVVCNGKVAKDIPLGTDRTRLDAEGTVPISQSGWCVFRAWADHAEYPVLDNYPYATTSPIYFTVARKPTQSVEDARFFMQWIDRLIANADANKDWNTPWEKEHVMDVLQGARKVYEAQTQ